MIAIVSESNRCCGTCQSWSGCRKYEPRLKRIVCDYSGTSELSPCSMKYKKSPSTTASCCQGYVRWYEIAH